MNDADVPAEGGKLPLPHVRAVQRDGPLRHVVEPGDELAEGRLAAACVGAMSVVVIAVGGYFIMQGKMDYADLTTFSLYQKAPMRVTQEIKRSSGPWWESSPISKRSVVMRLMSWPVRFWSKKENDRVCIWSKPAGPDGGQPNL